MKINTPSKIINASGEVLNKVMIFFMGLFISAIIFIVLLKIFSAWGIFVALIIGFALNFYLKKNYRQHLLLNSFNNGLLTFNIITTISGIILYILFYSVVQSLLS